MPSATSGKAANRKTRREMLQLGGLAIAASALASKKAAADCCNPQGLPVSSVFTTVCDDDSAVKYGTGDTPATFRLAALWLLITTEDWSQHLRQGYTEDQFKSGLVSDLGLPSDVVGLFWQMTKDNADAFKAFRGLWQNETADDALYGKRPCIGGKSALQIACLATAAAPAKSDKKKK